MSEQDVGSKVAQMQSEVTKNHKARDETTMTTSQNKPAAADLTPQEQSQLDRNANYAEQSDIVSSKLATKPESLTKDEANKLHSREQKAFGSTEKGGLASQAHRVIAEKESATK